MPANPITDQYLADMRNRMDPTLEEVPVARNVVEVMRTVLPDIDPAVIGEVMLHAGVVLVDLVKEGGWTPCGVGVLLTVAGRRLHEEGRP